MSSRGLSALPVQSVAEPIVVLIPAGFPVLGSQHDWTLVLDGGSNDALTRCSVERFQSLCTLNLTNTSLSDEAVQASLSPMPPCRSTTQRCHATALCHVAVSRCNLLG